MKEILEFPEKAQFRDSPEHQAVFSDAGEEYFHPPVEDLDPNTLTPENALEKVAENYFNKMRPERREYVTALTEEVRANDEELLDEPSAIITVPAAAHNETPETLDRMFDIFARQEGADKLELFLYGNYPNTIGFSAAEKAHTNISEAVMRAKQRHPSLHIRHATVGYEEANMGMGGVRKDIMDIVAADSVTRGLKYNQPVVWVDADVTSMSRKAMHIISDAVLHDPSSFTHHMSPRLTVEDIEASGLSKAGLGQKIAADYEIKRRQTIRDTFKEDKSATGVNHDYVEEWGLGFMLGNYLAIGGVNQGDPVSETTWLHNSYGHFYEKVQDVISNATGQTDPSREICPRFVNYIPGARIYGSARRIVAKANFLAKTADRGSPANVDIGDMYEDFSHTETFRGKTNDQSNAGLDENNADYVFRVSSGHNTWKLRQDDLYKPKDVRDRVHDRIQNIHDK